MLIDYFKRVKDEIDARRAIGVDSLIASSSSHDLHRGQIQGLDQAMGILREVMAEFSNPEDDVHPAVSGTTEVRTRRWAGNLVTASKQGGRAHG